MSVSELARALEAEAIHIMREVAAELERPVLLFSGGKDSIVLLRLAEKAFRPGAFPFPVLHVDTGHNFPEVLEFRDRRVAELGEQLIVASVQDSIDAGRVRRGAGPSRNRLQTATLLDAIEDGRFDAAFGGARRDEERARAKERVLLVPRRVRPVGPARPAARGVEPLQRPRPRAASTCASFPLSNWTELDVWRYIAARGARAAVDLLRPRARGVRARRDAARRSRVASSPRDGEEVVETSVRYRTVGDMTVTGAVRSRGGRRRRRDRRDRRHAAHRARRDARRRPRRRRPRWRTASARATSRCRTCCASPPPARSTTASRP